MLSTTDFKRGLKIEIEGVPYEITEFLHVKPGKGGAFVRSKLRNLLNGRIIEQTFRSGEKFEKPDMENKVMQFLYREGDQFAFMDLDSYEQVSVPAEQFGEQGGYLKDGQEIKVLLYNGGIIELDLPASVILLVTETEPAVKGDTVSNVTKAATVETGISIQVPLFISTGDSIKVDTRNGNYINRE